MFKAQGYTPEEQAREAALLQDKRLAVDALHEARVAGQHRVGPPGGMWGAAVSLASIRERYPLTLVMTEAEGDDGGDPASDVRSALLPFSLSVSLSPCDCHDCVQLKPVCCGFILLADAWCVSRESGWHLAAPHLPGRQLVQPVLTQGWHCAGQGGTPGL